MEFDKPLRDILRERADLKGLTIARLRQQTGIAERYLTALLEGKHEKLPALPYVRGYLLRLAAILELDGEHMWDMYQHEAKTVRSSGSTDVLPHNRFALEKLDRRKVVAAVVGSLVLLYLLLNINRFLGRPPLDVTLPAEETTTVSTSPIIISGSADTRDTVRVDGSEITLSPLGTFETSYELKPGLNSIEITSERLLGRTARVVRQIVYEPTPQPPLLEGVDVPIE